jgi:SNF2 family DNA or RNA helicase
MASKRKLFPYQEQVLEWTLKKDSFALWLQMRLGKTLITIRNIKENELYPVLIVAPLTVLPVWEKELALEGVKETQIKLLRPETYKKWPVEKPLPLQTEWYLTNYEFLRTHSEILYRSWACVVLDESSKIRNPKAQVTQLLSFASTYSRTRILLSGTPDPESPLNYFSQMNFLGGNQGWMGCKNFWEFRAKYFHQTWSAWYWRPNKNTLAELQKAVKENSFTLTRQAAGIENRKIYETRHFEMTPKQKEMYQLVKKEFRHGLQTKTMTKSVLTQLVWLCRIAGGFSPEENVISEAKTKELVELLTGELKEEKVIIWF